MKKGLLVVASVFLFLLSVSAQIRYTISTVPNPKTLDGSYVSNPDSILSKSDCELINLVLKQIEDSSGVEVAVVVVNEIDGEDTKDFRYRLFNQWGIGKKGKDNGLLLLIVKKLRTWDFETGYGLESILPDGRLKVIGESIMVPEFKEDSMMVGIVKAMLTISKVIQKDTSVITSLELYENPYQSYTNYEEVRDPSRFNGEVPLQWIYEIQNYTWVGYVVFLLGVMYSFFQKRASKNFQSTHTSVVDFKKGIPISFARWFLLYWVLPLVLPFSTYLFLPADYSEYSNWITMVILGAYALISFLVLERMVRVSKFCKNENKQLYITNFNRENDGTNLFFLGLFFPLVMIPYYFWTVSKKKYIRQLPIQCAKCSTTMRLVTLEEAKKYLSDGQIKEVTIGALEYDVWACGSCAHSEIIQYDGSVASYSNCTSCHFKTAKTTKTETLVAATYDSTGTQVKHFTCMHCGKSYSKEVTTPKLVRSSSSGKSYSSSSSSSRSSSSGGGGGGSFGGGRSGGGGAGGKW